MELKQVDRANALLSVISNLEDELRQLGRNVEPTRSKRDGSWLSTQGSLSKGVVAADIGIVHISGLLLTTRLKIIDMVVDETLAQLADAKAELAAL